MLRLLACLSLAALFSVSASTRERRANPPIERLLTVPERWEGAEIRVDRAVGRRPDWVEVDGLPLPIRGTAPAEGELVELRGTFRKGRLELARSRPLPPWTPIPALALAWAAWNLFRHFRARA